MSAKVAFLNSRTCGIYKTGSPRYKTDPQTGLRTQEIDNQLLEDVELYLNGRMPDGAARVSVPQVFAKGILVPTYFDDRYDKPIREILRDDGLSGVALGELVGGGRVTIRGGHGSPGNDQRLGDIPYIKVSDIRGLRININPTNLVTENIASRLWGRGRGRGQSRASDSGLLAWDLITPNRASSNIGEFAILVPGEERVVLTKEVFVFRVAKNDVFDQFYLLWAFCLKAVRDQWKRIALMQTNREDCGKRHLEIIIPMPKSKAWAAAVSSPFRNYFTTIDTAKMTFAAELAVRKYDYIANVLSAVSASSPIIDPAN